MPQLLFLYQGMQKLSLCRCYQYHSGLTLHFILSVPGAFPSHNWEDEIKKKAVSLSVSVFYQSLEIKYFTLHFRQSFTIAYQDENPPLDEVCRLNSDDMWCLLQNELLHISVCFLQIFTLPERGRTTHQLQLCPFHLLSFQILEVVVVVASTWNQYLHSQHHNHPHLHLTSQETRLHIKQTIKRNQASFPLILSYTCLNLMSMYSLTEETILIL